MTVASAALQIAVYDVLKAADPQIADGRIYAPAPEQVVFPYVEIGDTQFVRDDVQESHGGDEFITLHVWSRPVGGQSQLEVKNLIEQVSNALHVVALTVAGASTAHAFIRGSRVLRESDGMTFHGVIDLRVQIYA